MKVTVHIGDLGLEFSLPSAVQCRGAWELKSKGLKLEDENDAPKLFDQVAEQLAACLVGCTDETEDIEALKSSALLWGPTGLGVWSELFFRNYRTAS